MKLPVVKQDAGPSPDAMWRQYTDLVIDHTLAVGTEIPTEGGRLIGGDTPVSRRLPGTAVLPDGATAGTVDGLLNDCNSAGLARPRMLRDGSVPDVTAAGFRPVTGRLLRLRAAPPTSPPPAGLLVLPVRSARRAFQSMCAERFVDEPTAAVWSRHLDDPQYDAAVALRDGVLLGVAALQTRGQSGLVCEVWVRPVERRRGIGTLLVGRVADLAARAQLAVVYAATTSADAAEFLQGVGFDEARRFVEWLPEATKSSDASGISARS